MENKNYKLKFGETITKYRRSIGISQDELALRVGLHRTYISDVERGRRNISLLNIIKLAEGLEVKPSVIFKSLEEDTI